MSPAASAWRRLLEDPERAAQMFPSLAGALAQPMERRRLLKLMAASIAMGGLAGCDPAAPEAQLVPAVVAPPGIVPGIPNFYGTASIHNGTALGIVVKHEMGRPIKVEGNPHHPSSLGATDVFAQGLLLDFYDPDRSIGLQNRNQPSDFQALLTVLTAQRAALGETRGAGFRILTGTIASPSLGAAIDALLLRYPEARWYQWQPISRDAVRQGAMLAYGRAVDTLLHVDKADVILALDSDLLDSTPGHVRYAGEFATRRNPTRGAMNRLYAAEPTPTLTGAAADHRFIAGPQEMHAAVIALASGLLGGEVPSGVPRWVAPVVADLKSARGHALVHVGPDQPAETHALVHAMNDALNARGSTLDLIQATEHRPTDQTGEMRALQDDMLAGKVETLLIIDSNPVFAAPGFGDALKRVKLSLCTAPSLTETGAAATWYVPQAHDFETWGDGRAHDGTATVLQPQALPLYGGRSAIETLSLFAEASPASPLAAVQRAWRDRLPDADAWRSALARGIIDGTQSPTVDARLRADVARIRTPAPAAAPLTVLFRPDPHLSDGSKANNPWLQELPRPLTKLTWDNPLLISPARAKALGLESGDEGIVSIGATSLTLPVWIMPGQASDCAVALLGFGRRVVGEVGTGTGFDLYPLRAASAVAGATATLRKGTGRQALASTDHRNPLAGDSRDIVRRGTLTEFTANPKFLHVGNPIDLLYRRKPEGAVAWGMSVDLNACIGCNACVIACQAENNVPVVGKENVLREREMHWLRIDRYYDGHADNPDSYFQPMLCQHCEQAPCETVCPVGATVHDDEGLNVMVYNRCVGTRFCSNNCPYKVRRFNYSGYAADEHRPAIARNPDVTVRARGVMEKCTFCLQRIAEARIAHDRDGSKETVTTACQAACPTHAFTFGDLNDRESAVAARKQSPLDYVVLPDQATYPRVTYEAKIRNPNPAIVE
jgi:Fe-S-cluster-containing dehydrogenase component